METIYNLKNVRTFNSMDGGGYECKLYKGKIHIASAVDDGWGAGSDIIFTDDKYKEELLKYIKTNNITYQDYDGNTKYCDVDTFINRLLDNHMEDKEHKKMIKSMNKKTWFILKSDKGQYARYVASPYNEEVKKYLVEKYKDDLKEILNETYKDEIK